MWEKWGIWVKEGEKSCPEKWFRWRNYAGRNMMIVPLLQVMQVLESQMSGQPVKPEVSAEERVERCREKQGLLESRCRHLFCFCGLIFSSQN